MTAVTVMNQKLDKQRWQLNFGSVIVRLKMGYTPPIRPIDNHLLWRRFDAMSILLSSEYYYQRR